MDAPHTHTAYHGHPLDILLPMAVPARRQVALRQFLGRAIARRYRLSTFGFLWTILVPLFTLAIYTFVFGVVLPARGGEGAGGTISFGLHLFAGLVVFWLMAEVVTSAPSSVAEHANLVKKAVFPLEIIPLVTVGSAVFHTLVSTGVLLAAALVINQHIHATALLFPFVLLPFVLMLMGFAWVLSAVGVYFRDIAHVVGLLMTGFLFLSPIFYSVERLSPTLQIIITLNPVTFIVTQARNVILDGKMPDWAGLALYLVIAWAVASIGLAFFRYVRKSFGDVL